MQKNAIETIIGAAVLAVAAGFVAFAYKGSEMSIDRSSGYTVKAKFANATGINTGSDVRIGGIKVGTVSDMQLDSKTYDALVYLHINDKTKVPADSSAAIVGSGLLSDKFVQIVPGGDDAMLKEGGTITFTQSSVSLEELIGKLMFSGGGVDKGDKSAPKAQASPPQPSASATPAPAPAPAH
ncbi:MAG: outer membrane lipid asymmetry maintenance protein MlaD [Alphaproteobacteria bacterium]|nr:outer membrane lipid asymmetry maintenance protein MlaD [Alphaproteobacteria bacterium]